MTLTINSIGSNNYIASKPVFRGYEAVSYYTPQTNIQSNEKKNDQHKLIKYLAIIAGTGLAIFAGVKGVKKLISNRNSETLINEAGQRVPKAGFRGEAVTRADEVPGIARLWPEIEALGDRIDSAVQKAKNGPRFANDFKKMPLSYYIDSFRLGMTVPAEKLKCLREADQSKFSDVFDRCRIYFEPEDGVLIYGKNETEKKKLFDYFIDEAKKYDMDVEYISTKEVPKGKSLGEVFIDTFRKAEKKFLEQKKHTLLVIEDAEPILQKDMGDINAIWNGTVLENAKGSGQRGVITLTTVKDINSLDESCIRGGRIQYKIDIDDALAKQAEIDKTK